MGKSSDVLSAVPAGQPPSPPAVNGHAASTTSTEQALADVLAGVLRVDHVPPDGHFFDDLGADSMLMAQFCARVRKRPELPSVSMKDVYQHPTVNRLATALSSPRTLAPASAPPGPSPVAQALADVLAGVLRVDHVPPDGHFFDDLGADSMLMAQFCARVRKRPELPSVSMKDVYKNPSVNALAVALAPAETATPTSPAMPVQATAVVTEQLPVATASTRAFVLCGAAQFLLFLGYTYLAAVIFERGFSWINAGVGILDIYLRSVAFAAIAFTVSCTIPILAKWALVGRWKRQQVRIWSLAYLRFWLVKTLVSANPLVLFAGSPLYNMYLRALGAKVGRGAVIMTRHVPVCTDLFSIGSGSVVLKDSFLSCYRAQSGIIHAGAVTIGRDVFVGERAVLDVETSLGDGSQLGHASSLHAGQAIPTGEHWHGSPGQRTDADYRGGRGDAACGTLRRAWYSLLQLLTLLLVYLPLAASGLVIAFTLDPWLEQLLTPGEVAYTTWAFFAVALGVSSALFVGYVALGLLIVYTVPRLLNRAIRPDTVYPLYGWRYSFHRTITRMTNRKFFHKLTGDSSFIAYYLRGLGWRLAPLVQTGSNFGSEVKHENPYLSRVGSGTVIASDISMVNAHYSSTSFWVSEAAIGTNNFLGNQIVYPSQGRTGNDCLLATKVLVPVDGPIREGVGLLGSPAFEIPRSVSRDTRFYHLATGEALRTGLRAKNRHNLWSIAFFLFARWLYAFLLTVIGLYVADHAFNALAIAYAEVLILTFSVVYFSLIEQASTGFRGVRPLYCSIYHVDFWRVERFFKLQAGVALHRLANGTPLKPILYRLVGVTVGRRLFDDGSGMSEKNMVTLGDDVTLGAGSFIQCHSQEDYAFKSDTIHIGSGCTVGIAAMVHYGTTMGDGATLAPDSFLMKGEEVPDGAYWGGNPARELTDDLPALARAPRTQVRRRRRQAHARDRTGQYLDAYLEQQFGCTNPHCPMNRRVSSGLYFDQYFDRYFNPDVEQGFDRRLDDTRDRAAAGDRSHA